MNEIQLFIIVFLFQQIMTCFLFQDHDIVPILLNDSTNKCFFPLTLQY